MMEKKYTDCWTISQNRMLSDNTVGYRPKQALFAENLGRNSWIIQMKQVFGKNSANWMNGSKGLTNFQTQFLTIQL